MNFKTFDIFKNIEYEEDHGPKSLLPESFCGLIVGKPGSGKSTIIKLLLHEKEGLYKKFDLVLFITPYTISDLQIPEDRISNTFSFDWIIQTLESFQKQRKIKNCLLIIDDQISIIKKASEQPEMINLFFNRRKQFGPEISLLITTQKYTMFPAKFRSSLQFLIVFQVPQDDFEKLAAEQIYGSIAAMKPIIKSHFAQYIFNFLYIRLSPYSVHLNFDKIIS